MNYNKKTKQGNAVGRPEKKLQGAFGNISRSLFDKKYTKKWVGALLYECAIGNSTSLGTVSEEKKS